MRYVIRILIGLVIIALAVFAIANRQTVTLSFHPLPFDWSVPLYVAILCAFAAGLLIGTALTAIGRERMRWRARTGERRAEALETELAHRGAAGAAPSSDLPRAVLPPGPARTRIAGD